MVKRTGYSDHPIVAETYDLIPAYSNRPDRDFYLRHAADTGGNILELGCGTGRILIPMAEEGHAVTGLDISENMLAKCRRKLASVSREVSERVELIKRDMTDFDIGKTFHMVIIPGHSFQHLIGTEDQIACLGTINRHLKMRGRLILDVVNVDFKIINNPRQYEETEEFPECKLPDGRLLRHTGRVAGFHPTEQYNDVELIYYLTDRTGKTERIVHGFPYRYFFRYEIEHLLARCGFEIVDLPGNFDESPLADGSPEMIFIAEKNKEIG